MLVRALIVLLLVLNAGVASWWIARDPVPPLAPAEPEPVRVAHAGREQADRGP